MAMLQVVINPLLRTSGGEEHYAFNSVLAQLIFGLASFLSPLVYSYMVLGLSKGSTNAFLKLIPHNLPWISLYWLFAIICLLMIMVIGPFKISSCSTKYGRKGRTPGNAHSIIQKKESYFILYCHDMLCWY
jgi:fucose permease